VVVTRHDSASFQLIAGPLAAAILISSGLVLLGLRAGCGPPS